MDEQKLSELVTGLDKQVEQLRVTLAFSTRLLQDIQTVLGTIRKHHGDQLHPMSRFAQTDDRWKDEIYSGTATFGRYGCYVTCFAMIASQIKPSITPVEMAGMLRDANCFGPCQAGGPPNCLNYPGRIESVMPRLQYDGSLTWEETPMPIEALQDALREGPVIADVDGVPADIDHDQHFVVITGIAENGFDAEIIDSYDGKRGFLLEKYGRPGWTLGRAIYGLRLLRVR